uniref:Uncharacterized protein n=1 Tax=Anguilla anguilla TaxID=7936 RepID=A0A0E9XHX5_ANGAN
MGTKQKQMNSGIQTVDLICTHNYFRRYTMQCFPLFTLGFAQKLKKKTTKKKHGFHSIECSGESWWFSCSVDHYLMS